MIKITLKDGSIKEYQKGISIKEVAEDISQGLARVALVGMVNDEVKDLSYKLESDCNLSILTFNDDEGKNAFRHTTSHILAQAVEKLFPDVKLAIGPAIENGFYYDFDMERSFTPEDLEKIEKEMEKIVKEDLPMERFELSKDDALFLMKDEPYKTELINDLPEGEILSFYKQGDFTDLCAGPHVQSTGKIKAFKLTSIAGAYWRGNEKNKMLQRIYGTSFEKKSELDEYINMLEEAKKRDHKKIGRELDLFSFHPEAPGACFWHPKGLIIWQELEKYWRDMHNKNGYTEIQTPQLAKKELWVTSGHWDHYQEDMYHFDPEENETLCLKPMDCPFGILIYKTKSRSYRDLPIRFNELGRIFRNEKSGQLNGLFRVRQITQDDAHILCTEEQIFAEISSILRMQREFYKTFDLQIRYYLSTRPDDFMGEVEVWDKAEQDLRNALERNGIKEYGIKDKDGAFYGPKIDVQAKDALGRTWQLATIQLDFQLPSNFEMTYIDADGQKKTPVMIHRAIFGSFERFMGIITEQFAGAFPTWLSPTQVKVIPITDKHKEYAQKVSSKLVEKGIRAEIDDRAEKMGYKIREAQLEKIPYMLVVGDKEAEDGTVAIRTRAGGDQGVKKIDEFIKDIVEEVEGKRI